MTGDPTQARPKFLPTPDQELLLQACLLEDDQARAAWQVWRKSKKLDDIDLESSRLLPMLARRLTLLGEKDPDFDRYRGIQRRSWALNKMLFRSAAHAVGHLGREQIPVLALKGLVLALRYYEDMSLRPMDDFDLLVHARDCLRALDKLEEIGWRIAPGQMRPRTRTDLAVRAACAMGQPGNPVAQLDLHWRLLWGRYSKEADAALWERADSLEFDGARCLMPCATDLLVHVCAHGTKWNDTQHLRWVIDAALLVRSGEIDWHLVCKQAARSGLTLPLAETLHYLNRKMDVAVPGQVIQELYRSEVAPIDRLLYESEMRPPMQRSFLTTLKIHQYIAWQELVHEEGPRGYWHYFRALRQGRSLKQIASWLGRQFGGDA